MQSDHLQPKLVSLLEAGHLLGIGRTKTRDLVEKHVLETIQIGTRRLVTLRSIEALVESASGGKRG